MFQTEVKWKVRSDQSTHDSENDVGENEECVEGVGEETEEGGVETLQSVPEVEEGQDGPHQHVESVTAVEQGVLQQQDLSCGQGGLQQQHCGHERVGHKGQRPQEDLARVQPQQEPWREAGLQTQ